jgi:hypothetical protein
LNIHPENTVIFICPITQFLGVIIPAWTLVRPISFPLKGTERISELEEILLHSFLVSYQLISK